MSDKTSIVIDSNDFNSSTPLIINGIVRKRIRHNEITILDADELAALTNSNKSFRVVGDTLEIVAGAIIPAAEATGGAGGAGASAAPPDSGNSLNVEPFDVEGILAQTIKKITEDMDEFNADQVGDLLTAEQKREKPRPTLVEALTKKAASFAA